jgi:cytochrome c oxidase cbb3-type subunit III
MTKSVAAAGLAGLVVFVAHLAAQAPAQTPPAGAPQTPPAGAPQAPPAGAPQTPPQGQGRGRGLATFPAQQRPPGDPAMIARGQSLFGVNCRLCHGADLRGGDMGGVNLLRSQLVLNDQDGELILPVVKGGRQNPGLPPMPPFPQLSDDDVKALAAYIHSVAATMRGQGSPPPGAEAELNILVGDAKAGETYFTARCSSCHSPTGDLQGLASRVADPLTLQNLWVSGGGGGRGGGGRGAAAAGRGGAPAPNRRQVNVSVTPQSGAKVTGRLDRIDDFIVVLTLEDGTQRSFRRNGDVPKVDVNDPMEGHRKLLEVYTDKDIHDVTAFLVTLK